ncbi:uncharacterized protein RJT21DRAFT_117915 [Scheffersomyces amazonensis]|uniref:uncharacterized protein n=1 Tax=Scheffersomyces amazonensis TaxID=1078765 RepID=UPI00315CF657
MRSVKYALDRNPIMNSRHYLVVRRLTTMARLADLPKTSSFTDKISPDAKIDTKEIAYANENNITHQPRILSKGGFSWTLPEERKEYRFLTANTNALRDLGLDPSQIEDEEFQQIVSGQFYNLNKDSFEKRGYPFPYAQTYAGWQFGQFAGQLGDGRVVNLFEIPKINPDNKNRPFYELQLKGAGKTPYARFADGKAVTRSSIREYIISEHLNSIGIPTTRALSLTFLPKTYAQRSWAEKCSIYTRFAESWIRLGTFDLHRWRGDRDGIKQLSKYVIEELFTVNGNRFSYFNNIIQLNPTFFDASKDDLGELTDYDKMYYEIIVRNAETAALWQTYGFLNGVLNTDNTSVLGLSLDFGPFSIMDKYNPNYTSNSEDHELRYSYSNTPTAIWWNLTRLGEDLAELIGAGENLLKDSDFLKGKLKEEWEDPIIKRATTIIEIGGEIYQYAFTKKYVESFLNRLGVSNTLIDYSNINTINEGLITPLLELLYKVQCDFNKFFVVLQEVREGDLTSDRLLEKLETIESRYTNAELKVEIDSWLKIYNDFLSKSTDISSTSSRNFNPLFLPRNWILDEVIKSIEESEAENLTLLQKLEKMSFNPFDKSKWGDEEKEKEKQWELQGDYSPENNMQQCSCSS